MQQKNRFYWGLWLAASACLGLYLYTTLTDPGEDRTVFLPGQTTQGHYQIELACNACHGEAFSDADVIQRACVNCHGEPLKQAKDDHPKSKFTDPRNADRIAVLDARYCATCHVEHRPEITSDMGVTVPADVCFLCHENIAEDRPSHAGMPFDSCASAGCHNFHDNRALYEDFLLKHLDEDATLFGKQLLLGNLHEIAEQLPGYPLQQYPLAGLALEDRDAPPDLDYDSGIDRDWLESSHAASGVNCSACHQPNNDDSTAWVDKPDHSACSGCHAGEVSGFLGGKHGMRLNVEANGMALEPMTPARARLPMKASANGVELGCQSCHGAHAYDTARAPVDACLACHDDEHSQAYPGSPHDGLWQAELAGELPAGSGVTCASCHMPRLEKDYFWGTFVHNEVQHNQSATLRPNEKMIRPVCLECHGLGFAIDALADEALIDTNFSGKPSRHVESIDLARQRLEH